MSRRSSPHEQAKLAALAFLKAHGFPEAEPGCISSMSPMAELSTALPMRLGVDNKSELLYNISPVERELFESIRQANGYINFRLSDVAYERFCRRAAETLPPKVQADVIPVGRLSAEYLHARLLTVAFTAKPGFHCNAAVRRALWMCFSLLDTAIAERRRSLCLVSVAEALDDPSAICRDAALAMAGVIGNYIIVK